MLRTIIDSLWPWPLTKFLETALILVHISYILWDRNSRFWCVNATWDDRMSHTIFGHCDLDLWPSFNNVCVWSISLILLEIGIPNLVCGCILGWNVTYHFRVTVTFTYDLVLRIIVSGAYLLYYLRKKFQSVCVYASLYGGVSHTIFWSLWPWIIIVSGAYLYYYLRKWVIVTLSSFLE